MASGYDPVQAAFDQAVHSFKQSLDNPDLYKEILNTKSIDEVYDLTDELQKQQAKSNHLRNLAKIEPFLVGMREYASVIEVFIQAKPDVLALIWGPIKLLIQWTSVLKQSFDAVINITAEIGKLLPEFRDMATLFDQNKNIKEVLLLFFKDILDFYSIALRFFNSSRLKYIFESLWPRQRDKIQLVMTHIERHTLLLRNEVRLEHIRQEHEFRLTAFKHFDDTQKALCRQEYLSIKADIAPIEYGAQLDRLRSRTCQGTGGWLLKNSSFAKWLNFQDDSLRVLWLQGIPGAGKTFLSSIVVNKTESLGRTSYAFLTYERKSNTSALSIVQSLIFHLVAEEDNLQEVLCQSSRKNIKSSLDAAGNLLTTTIKCAGPVYLVIDGLDEISELERVRLINFLFGLLQACPEARCLISSRAENDIAKLLKDTMTLRADEHNTESIQNFVNFSTENWLRSRAFEPDAEREVRLLLSPLAAQAQGMFLYAKVVIDSIEMLVDLDEIRNELKVLPENLDAAYARVVQRIANLTSQSQRKAQRILGWVACSPTPLKIQELEQALAVKPGDTAGLSTVSASLPITAICGPIIEVVNEYVKFVHFTVQEYLRSPHIPISIDLREATLDLFACCITYLCQVHHDQTLLDEDIKRYAMTGYYRLHDLAAQQWIELMTQCSKFADSGPLLNRFVETMRVFIQCRANSSYDPGVDLPAKENLGSELAKKLPGDVNEFVEKALRFGNVCSARDFSLGDGFTKWTDRDPSTISKTSIAVYKNLSDSLCTADHHKPDHDCPIVQKFHGTRPFRCSHITCPYHRHGFERQSQRKLHVKQHKKSWKCSEPGCSFNEGGFLSRKMRDEHYELCHTPEPVRAGGPLTSIAEEDVQSVIFDAVRLGSTDVVEGLEFSPHDFSYDKQKQLFKMAGSSGSCKMINVLREIFLTNVSGHEFLLRNRFLSHAAREAVNVRDAQMLRHVLKIMVPTSEELSNQKNNHLALIYARVLIGVIEADSDELWKMWDDFRSSLSEMKLYDGDNELSVIRATDGRFEREERLLAYWSTKELSESQRSIYFAKCLSGIAQTTCSIRLAEFIVKPGVDVDFRLKNSFTTPLHYTVRQDSLARAQFAKWLLVHGADPDTIHTVRGRTTKIQDERGAKNIQKWLGMSWDELVTETRRIRAESMDKATESHEARRISVVQE